MTTSDRTPEERKAQDQDPHVAFPLEAELLDLLLDARGRDESESDARERERLRTVRLVALARDPGAERALAETRALLHRARDLDRRDEWTAARERRLIGNVLARTTRLDPGWRGDLRLVLDFVRERVANSSQLRVAAALLFVQCFVVLPAVAWVVLRPKPVEPHFNTGVVPREEGLPEGEQESLELELPADFGTDEAEMRRFDAQDNTRRRARFLLLSVNDLPIWEPAPALGYSGAKTLFRERLRLLSGQGAGRSLSELGAVARSTAERSLLALLALDRGLLLGRPPELGPLLNELALAEADGSADALALHVLARARAQGDWPAPTPDGWGQAGEDPVLPLGAAEANALRAVFGTELDTLRGW